jgi:hypothetical protein
MRTIYRQLVAKINATSLPVKAEQFKPINGNEKSKSK